MKQEDKELLLKDLSARLPHRVMCDIGLKHPLRLQRIFVDKIDDTLLDFYENGNDYQVYLSEVKPYLRPMSSMTEEEKKEYTSFVFEQPFLQKDKIVGLGSVPMCINWLLENHFDYRGLIKKGLAIEVTKDNNPYK